MHHRDLWYDNLLNKRKNTMKFIRDNHILSGDEIGDKDGQK